MKKNLENSVEYLRCDYDITTSTDTKVNIYLNSLKTKDHCEKVSQLYVVVLDPWSEVFTEALI